MARKRRKEAKGTTKRKVRKVRPMKIAALIVSAIQDLRETKGSTTNRIMGYISYASSTGDRRVKRQVKAALKRGVEYGILRKYRGQYFLPTGDELDRANRVAVRFAKLPLPPTHSIKSSTVPSRKIAPVKSDRKATKCGTSRNTKRLAKRELSIISPTVSLAETICKDDVCAIY